MATRSLIPISFDSILMPMTDKGRMHYSWADIIADEYQRHSQMTTRDLHKLVYQACFGGDHLLRNPDSFKDNLAMEWNRLPTHASQDPPLQPIHPSGRLARIHLGPCKAMGLSLRDVSQLLLSQPLKAGHREAYEWAWAMVLHCARSGEIPFLYDQLLQIGLSDEISHHGPDYGLAAYRIVNDIGHGPTREFLCRLGIRR
ncbi:hypothetical protein ACFLSG_02485 [Candidatus Bipolaricaulota bacterium]